MKIYYKSAEIYLYEQARVIQAAPEKWRAIYFHFSELEERYTDGLRTHIVVNIFTDLLRDHPGFVYLCGDGDIVILFQGMAGPVLEKLGDHVYGMLNHRPGMAIDPDSLCQVIDLRVSWQAFYELCERKYHARTRRDKPLKAGGQMNEQASPYHWDNDLFEQAVRLRAQRGRLQALIVEDDPFTRRLVVNAIRPHHDAMEAGEGRSALHIYNLNAPDIVFLDIELPDSNGHILLQEIIEQDPAAFIVMLSGNSSKENVIAALEDGAQGFVAKPFPKEKLLHYAANCARSKAQRGAFMPPEVGTLPLQLNA